MSDQSIGFPAPNDRSLKDLPTGFQSAFDEAFDDPCSNPYVDFHTYDFSRDPILGQFTDQWQADFPLDNRFSSSNPEGTAESGLSSLGFYETPFERDLINPSSKRSSDSADTIGSKPYHPMSTDQMPVKGEIDLSMYCRSHLTDFQEKPTQYISPAAISISGSLLELSNTSAAERTMFERQPERASTPEPTPPSRRTPNASARSKKGYKKTCSRSPSPESKREQKRGLQTGINRKTVKPPIIGVFPANMEGKIYTCPLPQCEGLSWTTPNGYKYHLNKVCLQNPLSERSERIAAGLPIRQPRREGVRVFICDLCGHKFKSENGIRLHQKRNAGTRDGRCTLKLGKGQESRSPGKQLAEPQMPRVSDSVQMQMQVSPFPGR